MDADLARAVLPDDAETELAAALVLARKRRIGPFRASDAADRQRETGRQREIGRQRETGRQREIGILARAGFPRAVAERALDTDAEEAEAAIRRLRQG